MQRGQADLIVVGGTIHTVDAAHPAPQAIAIRGDRFVHAGSLDGAMALRGPATQVLDVGGQTVLPGLIDAHIHLTHVGLKLGHADLFGLQSYAEVVDRTVRFAKESLEPWIVGDGWDQNLWPSSALPNHKALSAAIPDRPVVLTRVDGHALLANARAMKLAGVHRTTTDPAGGRILRDTHGDPAGVFIDSAQRLIDKKIPEPSQVALVRATRDAIRECNRWGVTAVAEAGVSDAIIAAHAQMIESGDYSIRNYMMLADQERLIDRYLRSGAVDGAHDGRLWIRAIKMFADGALGSRGAALLEPYADDPGNCGLIVTPQAHVAEVTKKALCAGFQVAVHAIGDRANRMVLDSFQAALRANGACADARLRIEHAQVLARTDIARFGRLGIIASMQATHQISDMAWAPARLGPQRLRGAYAWRALLDTGATVANGTDAPVEPVNTLRSFHAAVAGYPRRRMTRREALSAMTISAAHANFSERVIGSITPGKYADFVVMDRDWLTVPTQKIMGTKIVATYFGGRLVYGADFGGAPVLRPVT